MYPNINKQISIEFKDLQDQSVHWRREIAYVNFLKTKNECLMLQYKELYEKSLHEIEEKNSFIVSLKNAKKDLELEVSQFQKNETISSKFAELLEKELSDT